MEPNLQNSQSRQVNQVSGVIPYLPSVEWYRTLLSLRLHGEERYPQTSAINRGMIRGAWGEQTLTVPILGGRRHLSHIPYHKLRLSEHDDWRHKHLQAITSAYGAMPYFQYFKHLLEEAFHNPYCDNEPDSLSRLCMSLHHAFMAGSNLEVLIKWLSSHPEDASLPHRKCDIPSHISALELLFLHGSETIFYLL